MNKRKITIHFAMASAILASVLLPGIVFGGGAARPDSLLNIQSPSPGKAAQKAERRAALEELTNKLITQHARYQFAGQAERSNLVDNLFEVAAARWQALAASIEDSPGEVLRVALPANLREGLPEAIQSLLEQQIDVQGELEVLYECGERGNRLLYFVEAAGQRFALHFASNPPDDLLTGARVRVKGVRVGDDIVMESGSGGLQSADSGFQALVTPFPNIFGEQKVLVILVNFQDKQTQPYTVEHARNIMFGSVNNYYTEVSYQQTWLSGDVVGWYTLPLSSTDCNSSAIATYAKQAATAAGVNVSAYKRLVYAFPSISCGWAGLGSVGGNPSQAWINTSFQLRVVGHELGHNLGLYHAKALECGNEVMGSSCTTVEYGSILDILGKSPNTGHVHAYQKERLGWLDYGVSPSITTVQSSGTYRIDPYETMGFNPKALKIYQSTDSSGRRVHYYVEVRRAIGVDSYLSSNSNVMNGVAIHLGTESSGSSNYLLDMTPETSSWSDPALVVGRSYNDPNAGVTITPLSINNTEASVNVTFGPQPCVSVNPSASLSPSQTQWVQAGTKATYTITVTNKDSDGCASSSFDLQATVPDGWTAAFASQTLNVNPGTSASTTLQVTSPSWAAEGFYDLGVSATNSVDASRSVSISATYAIISSLGVSVWSDQSSYSPGKPVSLSSAVTVAGSPASGTSVEFKITKPNGSVVKGTATTGNDGKAVYNFRLNKKKDPVGTYQVEATASLNGITGNGTTTFTVK